MVKMLLNYSSLFLLFLFNSVRSQNDCHCGVHQVNETFSDHSTVHKGMYPWLARVRTKAPSSKVTNCLGVILSPEYILTSFQCIEWSRFQKIGFRVHVGNELFASNFLWQAKGIKMKNPSQAQSNLLGVIKLSKPLQFNENVQPICLPDKLDLENADQIVAIATDEKMSNIKQVHLDRGTIEEIARNDKVYDNQESSFLVEHSAWFFKKNNRWFIAAISNLHKGKMLPVDFNLDKTVHFREDIDFIDFDIDHYNQQVESCKKD